MPSAHFLLSQAILSLSGLSLRQFMLSVSSFIVDATCGARSETLLPDVLVVVHWRHGCFSLCQPLLSNHLLPSVCVFYIGFSSVVHSLSSPAGALQLLTALAYTSTSGLESKCGHKMCTQVGHVVSN